MHDGRRILLRTALRLQQRTPAHAELVRQVILFCLVAEALAAAAHDGPPHAPHGRPRDAARRPARRLVRSSLSGRRPRG